MTRHKIKRKSYEGAQGVEACTLQAFQVGRVKGEGEGEHYTVNGKAGLGACALKAFPKRLIINIIPFLDLVFFKKHISFEIVQHALGIKTKVMQDSIPENAQAKAIFISRIYVGIWLLIILWSILASSWMPLLYFVLPQFYGKTLHKLVAFTQHAGLARNIKDHRVTSREMYLNPILSFLYWKMEYHVTHHMFPTVPSYNLDKLHHHIKDQLPRTNDGLIDAYKEILPALMKQKEDSNYFFKKEVPELQNA